MTGRRLAGLATLVGVTVLVAVVVLSASGGDYTVRAEFANAGGLRDGFNVRVDGVPAGKVTNVDLGAGDRALVEARIDAGAAPLGSGARATVRAVNLLGEKYLDIERGDMRHPVASGTTIPRTRTGVAVELDDVIDTLDLPSRAALNVVLDEGGRGLGGRGRDLASLVAALPSGLDRTGELVRQVTSDNRALGRLVDESDRVVGAVAGERRALGRLVSAGAQTLGTLDDRRRQLADTIREGPATLGALRDALAALEGAAVPLAPAARGLKATAEPLTATLRELPRTARVASPALRAASRAAPSLDRLAREGTPMVGRLRPVARQLRRFSTDVEPGTRAVDAGIEDVLGTMEGWARATAARDAAGHVFRLDTTLGSDLLAALATADAGGPPRNRSRRHRNPATPSLPRPAEARPPRLPTPRLPDVPKVRLPNLPALPQPRLPDLAPSPDESARHLLDYLLEP